MVTIEAKTISNFAKNLYNIILDEGHICLGYIEGSYTITDVLSKKKYILEIVGVEKDSDDQELMDIIDQVIKNAYEFTSKNKYFSTPKIVKTCNGELSDFVRLWFKDKHGLLKKKMMNVKLYEFLPGQSICEIIKNCEDFSKREARNILYLGIGNSYGKLTHFYGTQSKYLDKLASIKSDVDWTMSRSDCVAPKVAYLLYPDKSHPNRIIIDRVFDEYYKKKERIDALPKRVIHGVVLHENILMNLEKSHLDPSGDHDFQRLHFSILNFQNIQVGPQCFDLATIILYYILAENRNYDLPFAALLKIPKLIIKGYKRHSSSAEFFSTGQLELLPTIIKFILCNYVLKEQLFCNPVLKEQLFPNLDPTNKSDSERGEYAWKLLKAWIQLFDDDDELIDIWSK